MFTNYHEAKPYIEATHYLNKYTGLFPSLLSMIVDNVCTDCKSYRNPPIFYNRTRDGQPAMKIDLPNVLKAIDDSTHFTFPIFGNFLVTSYSGEPFVGVVPSQGSAMIIYQPKIVSIGFVRIFAAVANAKSVILIAILLMLLVGWLLWFTVRKRPSNRKHSIFCVLIILPWYSTCLQVSYDFK